MTKSMSSMSEGAVMVRPVRTERDYEDALDEIGRLMASRPGTPDGDQLDVLSTLVEAYEAEHYPIDAPDPIALIEFAMEQRGATRADLEPIIGSRGRVSEVLRRNRSLTLAMIRKLNERWGLPADVLVQHYPLRKRTLRTSKRIARPSRRAA
jgi:HTH-type transcriptional regulator/antitoxin HigA